MSRPLGLLIGTATACVAISLSGPPPGVLAQGNFISTPDTSFYTNGTTSIALDTAGNPIVAYSLSPGGDSAIDQDLRLVHCNDPYCIGGGDEVVAVDTVGNVGAHPSLALDSSGNPVVSYYRADTGDLKLLRCGDPSCSSGNQTTSPDTDNDVGAWSSIALDGFGYPVIAYHDSTNGDLRVLHCGSEDCSAGNTITAADTQGAVGWYPSLALDGSGNPVVSYYDFTNRDLKILHCDDLNCAGGGESIAVADDAGDVGRGTSLALDAVGNPVVSYRAVGLNVLHCGNVNCTFGNSLSVVDATSWLPIDTTSLVLDAAGRPVIAYGIANDLKVARCGNADCSSGNVISTPVQAGLAGWGPSIALDSDENPVVSNAEVFQGHLQIVHCGNPSCDETNDESMVFLDSTGNVGAYSSLELDAAGNPVISYYDQSNDNLKLVHCNDPNCLGDDENVQTPDTAGGEYTSLALDQAGHPVVSYHATGHLRVLHCNDPNCAPGGDSITLPDTADDNGYYTSLVLDASGNPVVSYLTSPSLQTLRVLHCNDPDCFGGDDSITSPIPNLVGLDVSLALDKLGKPVISYSSYSYAGNALAVLQCGDPNCAGPSQVAVPDSGQSSGAWSSLALDRWGRPVVSHWSNYKLRLTHCGNVTCTMNNASTTIDGYWDTGLHSSMKLDPLDYPVVAYFDNDNGNLKLIHCGNESCSSGNAMVDLDRPTNVGLFPSLELDAVGHPVISYLDRTSYDLKLVHCNDPYCVAKPNPGKQVHPGDTDGDGCSDQRENGLSPHRGGQRDYASFWDFYDTPDQNNVRDKAVNLIGDILRVAQRFGANDAGGTALINRNSDPLAGPPPAAPAYHPAFDRGLQIGPNVWDLAPPDGTINVVNDILGVARQFGHSCL